MWVPFSFDRLNMVGEDGPSGVATKCSKNGIKRWRKKDVCVCVGQGDYSPLMSSSFPPNTLTLYSAFQMLTHCAVHKLRLGRLNRWPLCRINIIKLYGNTFITCLLAVNNLSKV